MKKKLSVFMITLCMLLMNIPQMEIHAEEYQRFADYIIYTEETALIGDIPLVGADAVGEIPEGIYYSNERSNYFYKIDVNGSSHWLYKYPYVEVKELRNLTNEFLTLQTNRKLYSEPFKVEKFEKGIEVPVGEYKVTKKAFDWFLISSDKYSGWVQIEDGMGILRGTASEYPDPQIDGVAYKTQIIPYSVLRRPGFVTRPTSITIHNTANQNEGAGAQRHADLQSNPSNNRQSSWHFTVDDHEIIQSVPINEVAYHAGDGLSAGNGDSIAIEICENVDGDFDMALHNTAKLVANLLIDLNLTINDVKMHRDWSGKNCPAVIIGQGRWDAFLAEIQAEMNGLIPVAVSEGWVKKGDNWNYNKDSQPVYWWNFIGKDWYYFDGSANLVYGWTTSDNNWYYSTSTGKMAKGWQSIDGNWYFLNYNSGAMARYWLNDNGSWYYLQPSGIMHKGWMSDGTYNYYMDSSGRMVTGVHTIEGVEYTFDDLGHQL